MKYEKIIETQFNDKKIEYGFVNGNNTIVFIKVGQDGSIYGYENKYLKMAHILNKNKGYSVIVSPNPFDGQNPLDDAMEVIEKYLKDNNLKDYKIYYFGHSNGARIGITWGYMYPKIKRMICVNSPIFINWHKLKTGLQSSNNQDIYLIYGQYDQSARYTELLNPLLSDRISLKVIDGADHNFTNMIDDFIQLPMIYFNN